MKITSEKVGRVAFLCAAAFLVAACSDEDSGKSCEPACEGRQCGPDGCGGTCGTCEVGTICQSHACVSVGTCEPACEGRQCGDDGCGGVCGDCAKGEVCSKDYQCVKADECKPACAGRQCGDDGCGGVCGNCAKGEVCSKDYQCVKADECKPACAGRQCGGDGCGGVCGNCAKGEVCSKDYQCVKVDECKPACEGRQCGNDGCGSVCGYCPGGMVCTSTGQCEPDCTGRVCGPDGWGGTCGGECPQGSTCNDSTGQCMPHSVRGRILVERQTVYYDSMTLPKLDKKVDEPGAHLPITLYTVNGESLGTAETDENGYFEIKTKRLPYSSDWLSIVPVWRSPGSDGKETVKLAIFVASVEAKDPYDLWQWTIKLSDHAGVDDPGNVENVRITTDMSSGGLYLYMTLKDAMESLAKMGFGMTLPELPSIGVLWKPGIIWSCGTCFVNQQTLGLSVGAGKSKVQLSTTMNVGGSSKDESAWGYPTLLHEFGHYVLYRRRDNTKGGFHAMNTAVTPTLAWSEGWATFYSLMAMSYREKKPVATYWRVLDNGSFWIDYGRLFGGAGGDGSVIVPEPKPGDGMRQNLGEGWVTHVLWSFFDGKEVEDIKPKPDSVALGEEGMFDGISSKRYTSCNLYNPDSRSSYGTDFVDFVDAVICNATKAGDSKTADAIMDLTISKGFPYDRSPVCP